jgi:hypothetical protein
MADVNFALIDLAPVEAIRPPVPDVADVVTRASAVAQEILNGAIVHDSARFEIAVEIAGSPEALSVHSPARPGAVKGAVEKVLRDLGLTKL